ncbi:hypothetical protein [Burkholderia sp. B21-005]|uniref:hypothetical protein n=1 Tax=Burkholderia sp. B21-005 TaxID=2890406 RepID=UPI001E640E0A|nr:hypothetical protein [Burkholderia sp. B21-005]UEP42768.1 hypothetical protein LMA02_07385 [Burkholderia sp. B21-005]
MYRIDDATAATSLPTPEAAGTEGYFTEGNPATGTPATKVRGSWLNMLQEELCSILAAAGIARSKTSYNQVNSALQKMYSPVIGAQRNLVMSVTAASATATLTADQIVVATALNGQTFMLSSFNKTINLATTGAGGMDTGTAPVSGYVALYAIYNPTTGASALLAKNATSAVQTNVYSGANMPSGYTASALVSVWPTNASSQFVVGDQTDRLVSLPYATISTISSQISSLTALSISSFAPPNARSVGGLLSIATTNSSNSTVAVASRASAVGQQSSSCSGTSAGGLLAGSSFSNLAVLVPQTIYWSATAASGTFTSASIFLSSYSI